MQTSVEGNRKLAANAKKVHGYSCQPSTAVTAADVQRVAEKYLKPDSAVVVAVGDRNQIEAELKKLNLGAIETRDLDGKPVP